LSPTLVVEGIATRASPYKRKEIDMSVHYSNGDIMSEEEIDTLMWLVKRKACVCDKCIEYAHYQFETGMYFEGYGIENCNGFIESVYNQ
jgi:hypothetical protein